MKKAILLPLLLGAMTAATAAVPTDTVATFVRPDSVRVKHNEAGVCVEVFGAQSNPDYYYSYERVGGNDQETIRESNSSDNWAMRIPFVDDFSSASDNNRELLTVECGGFGIGFCSALNAPYPMDVKMGRSIEVFSDRLIGLRVRPWRNATSFQVGFGLGWRNYRMTGDYRFSADSEGAPLTLEPYADGVKPSFSRLKIYRMSIPVLFSQGLGKRFEFNAGALVNFNVHGSMKTKYLLDGEERTYKTNRINQRKVTVDIVGQLSWSSIGVGVYVKYSPMSVLKDGYGPDFQHISTGITLFY